MLVIEFCHSSFNLNIECSFSETDDIKTNISQNSHGNCTASISVEESSKLRNLVFSIVARVESRRVYHITSLRQTLHSDNEPFVKNISPVEIYSLPPPVVEYFQGHNISLSWRLPNETTFSLFGIQIIAQRPMVWSSQIIPLFPETLISDAFHTDIRIDTAEPTTKLFHLEIDTSKFQHLTTIREVILTIHDTQYSTATAIPTVLQPKVPYPGVPKDVMEKRIVSCKGPYDATKYTLEGGVHGCIVCEIKGQNIAKLEILRNDTVLHSDARNKVINGIPLEDGAFSVKYDIPSPVLQDAGFYGCKITLNDGSEINEMRRWFNYKDDVEYYTLFDYIYG